MRNIIAKVAVGVCLMFVSPVDVNAGGLKSISDWAVRMLEKFSEIDTNYVEPQHYNFMLMLQATSNIDRYYISSKNDSKLTLSPDYAMKLGPFGGWRWVILGFTIDLKRFGIGNGGAKRDIEFSIYTSKIGVDLFYRRTGSNYKIRSFSTMANGTVEEVRDIPFDGLNVSTTGIDAYYIFNNKKFSYPAAFSQTTCQKLSCGSVIAGLGYMRNVVELDHEKLRNMVETVNKTVPVDSMLMFSQFNYHKISFSGGYGYNWVFAKNFLASGSILGAVSYNYSNGEKFGLNSLFTMSNFSIDGVTRLGLVYNNTKWFAGMSAILRLYNYHAGDVSTHNLFGALNFYVGFNFIKRKEYKKK